MRDWTLSREWYTKLCDAKNTTPWLHYPVGRLLCLQLWKLKVYMQRSLEIVPNFVLFFTAGKAKTPFKTERRKSEHDCCPSLAIRYKCSGHQRPQGRASTWAGAFGESLWHATLSTRLERKLSQLLQWPRFIWLDRQWTQHSNHFPPKPPGQSQNLTLTPSLRINTWSNNHTTLPHHQPLKVNNNAGLTPTVFFCIDFVAIRFWIVIWGYARSESIAGFQIRRKLEKGLSRCYGDNLTGNQWSNGPGLPEVRTRAPGS